LTCLQGQGQEEGADVPHFNVRFAGRELPNAQVELRSMHKLPHGLLHFMRAHSNIAGLPDVNERACRRVHLTLELDSGIAVKTDKTALKPGDMQDAQSMLTLGIVNLGRSKAVQHIHSMHALLIAFCSQRVSRSSCGQTPVTFCKVAFIILESACCILHL